MPETARSKPLEIWFQDEARVGQQGTLTRIWAERGTRPRAPRDTRYIWSYIFGAVCPERAEAAALIMPHADTQAMSAHLAEIAKTVASGAHALLILDGAGWHGSAELEVPDNITLLKLPPYSPEGLLPLLPVTPDVDRPSTFPARFLDRAGRCAGAFGLGEVGFECCQAGWRAGTRP